MPPPTWNMDERRAGFIMQAVLGLSDRDVHDIMGRMFGQRWAGIRKKYDINDIRDEIKYRWSPGKRHAHYYTIDPEGGPNATERANWDTTLTEIRTAARTTTGGNWLLQNAAGVLMRPLAVIPIPATLPAYQRNPATFDAVFYRDRPRPANRPAPVLGATVTATVAGPSSVAASTTPLPTATVAGPSTAAASTATLTHTTPVANAIADDQGWWIDMVHRSWLVEGQQRLKDEWVDADGNPQWIYSDSPVREYAGQIIRLYNPIHTDRFDDMLVCEPHICAWCSGVTVMDDPRIAELVEGVDAADSPTDRLPFVHLGRDTKRDDSGRRLFEPSGMVQDLKVPARTSKSRVWCIVRSGRRKRRVGRKEVYVLGCEARKCEVCMPSVEEAANGEHEAMGVGSRDDDDGEDEEMKGDDEDESNSGEQEEEEEEEEEEEGEESDFEEPLAKRPRRTRSGRRGGGGGRGGRRGGGGAGGGRRGGNGAAGAGGSRRSRRPGAVFAGQ